MAQHYPPEKLNRPAKIFLTLVGLATLVNGTLWLNRAEQSRLETMALCHLLISPGGFQDVPVTLENQRGEATRTSVLRICEEHFPAAP